ncbi:transmembrane and coiled-coil domain-containing protein 6 [Takifugu rubripes]|uniref:Transmembrane and coiled-coil domains 6 n=1 Tax=Takifugu rubripes TaxID=31033 RepID=A0A3B5KC36_TAKRU|nr:transmembrane and coiled-coil domain-containing protein 6 [Takifugu rubripes]
MWRLSKAHHKFGRHCGNLDEFKVKRREHEKELRQARRDRQLVSRRLLPGEDEDQADVAMDTKTLEEDVIKLFHKLLHSGSQKEVHLKSMSKVLQNPSAQLTFIKQENSMHFLVGLLTGSNAACRLQAARCLLELSHSPHASVAPACVPSTPYLLTYLSGQSTKFTVLCLYTLGNLCPADVVRDKLVAQGIIPALANCVENQRHNLAVVEAAGFTLSQLLQTKDAEKKLIPMVLASSLPSHLLSVLTPDPEFGLAAAIECAWCLYYLTCTESVENNKALLSLGALLACGSLLVSLGGAVAEGNQEDGMELLICPLLRCVGNLLSSCPVETLSSHVGDVRVVVALVALLQAYLQTQPALARECTWVLNNLTAHSTTFCSALVTFNLVPGLIQLLPFSQGINTMVLRVLANIAYKERQSCVQLAHLGLLPALWATLKMADREMVTLGMDVLFMLVVSDTKVAEEFVRQGGISLLEALQYNSEEEIRQRAAHLLERHLLPFSTDVLDSTFS